MNTIWKKNMEHAVLPCPTLVSSAKRFERAGVELWICQSTGGPPDLPLVPWQSQRSQVLSWQPEQQMWQTGSSLYFPMCHFHPHRLLLPFSPSISESISRNGAGRPGPEGQLQAPWGTVGVCMCLPDRGTTDQTACSACISPTGRLWVKASTRERNAAKLFFHVPCWVFVLFSTKEDRIRPYTKETLKILPISYFWRIFCFAFLFYAVLLKWKFLSKNSPQKEDKTGNNYCKNLTNPFDLNVLAFKFFYWRCSKEGKDF